MRTSLLPLLPLACLSLAALSLGACDKQDAAGSGGESGAQAMVATDLTPGKTAASLRLYSVVAAVNSKDVADVAALEAEINDPEAKINAVDIDEDGKTDFIEVVETHEGDKTVLVLQAIPSSKQDQKDAAEHAVVVAQVEMHVEAKEKIVVHATYSDHIEHDATVHVYHHEEPVVVQNGVIVVDHGCFYHHVFVVEHELYVGHHHHGLVIIETGPTVHHVHTKHKKHKGHGKGHGHGKHGHGSGVVVTW